MAFPTTGILDAFTGAGPTAPPSGNWSALSGFANALRLTGGQCDSNHATAFGADFWNVAEYGPDCEAYVTIDTSGSANQRFTLYIRLQSTPGSVRTGYGLIIEEESGTDGWSLFRYDAGVATQLGSTLGREFAAGDKAGIEMIGTTLKAYHYSGGSWTEVMSRTDATHTAAGELALAIEGQTWKFNDFGGGTISVVAPVNTVAPAVTGTPTEGSTLTTTNGTWDNVPTSYTYQWQRDTGGGMGNIGSATASTYVNAAADRLADLKCIVTAHNAGGSTAASSNTVADIGPLYAGALDAAGLELIAGAMTGSYSVASASEGVGQRRIQIGIGIGV